MMAHSYRGKLRWFDMLWHLSECIDPTIYIVVVAAYRVSYPFLISSPNVILTPSETAIDRNQ